MQRLFTNILSGDVDRAARFYEDLLGMHRHFESDWFVILKHEQLGDVEFGILERVNEIVPAQARRTPTGVILTFVVEDCDAIYERAVSLGAEILAPPTDMFYGQRRLLLRDRDGTVVDVSSPTVQAD